MEKTEYFDFYGVRVEVNGYFKSGTGGDNPDEVDVYCAHAISDAGVDFVEVTEWLERWPEFLEACEENKYRYEMTNYHYIDKITLNQL